MFARTLNVFPGGVALATVAVITLIVGSACRGPIDCLCETVVTFAGVARGAQVVPVITDTTPQASVTFNISSLKYTYSVVVAPAGTIDSIAFYQTSYRDILPLSATVILCAGAAACAATSGTATIVPPTTAATIGVSMRSYGTQIVFFTTTAQKDAGGAMRGTMYWTP